jgi:hypothetical protein
LNVRLPLAFALGEGNVNIPEPLLLNAGAPVLTVQTILGHKFIDTTLGYARLYDGTVAADYYEASIKLARNGRNREPLRGRRECDFATQQRPTAGPGGCPARRDAQRLDAIEDKQSLGESDL